MSVPVSDLRRAIRFLAQVTDDPGWAFSRPMLQELGRLLGADTVEYFTLRERDRLGIVYKASHDLSDPPDADEVFRRHPNQNPLSAFRWRPGDGALRLSTVVTDRALRKLDIYPVYFGPFHSPISSRSGSIVQTTRPLAYRSIGTTGASVTGRWRCSSFSSRTSRTCIGPPWAPSAIR